MLTAADLAQIQAMITAAPTVGEGFAQPIVAGQNLLIPGIQSPDFSQANGTGWAILKNGQAFFYQIDVDGGAVSSTQVLGATFVINSNGQFVYQDKTTSIRMFVPAYFFPVSPYTNYTQLNQAAPTIKWVVFNPDNGPGAGPVAPYPALIAAAEAAGLTVCGYVYTGFGAVPEATVQAQVNDWNTFYGVTNIFFDESANTAGELAYYTTVTGYVTPGAFIVLNMGSPPVNAEGPSYAAICSVMLIYEDPYADWAAFVVQLPFYTWMASYPASLFGVTVYAAPTITDMQTVVTDCESLNVGNIYVTDQTGDVFGSMPSYFTSEVVAIGQTVPAAGNLIESIGAPVAGLDPYGNSYFPGLTLYTEVGGTVYAFNIFASGFNNSPIGFAVYSATTEAGPWTQLAIFNNAPETVPGWVSSPVYGIQPKAISGSGGVPDTWNYVGQAGQPAFAADWGNYGHGGAGVAFRMTAAPANEVELIGVVSPSAGAGTTLFTLPASYRPVSSQFIWAINTTTGAACYWAINTSGAVVLGGSALTTGDVYIIAGRFSLDI